MKPFAQHYGKAEGPLGFPMTDAAARQLETLLKDHPQEDGYAYRRTFLAKGVSELQPGERADVSWISEESVDRDREIVLASGMDDSHFKLNPLVTLGHAYWQPPAGKSLWRKKVKEGALRGIKAKTHYPPRPEGWPKDDWLPDYAYELVKADLLRGKSIGFLPLQVRAPTDAEVAQHPELQGVRRIIEKWLLLEYACCFLPCQQNAVVETVSKGIDLPSGVSQALEEIFHVTLKPKAEDQPPTPGPLAPVAFTPFAEIEKELGRQIEQLDFGVLAEKSVKDAWDKLRGRV